MDENLLLIATVRCGRALARTQSKLEWPIKAKLFYAKARDPK